MPTRCFMTFPASGVKAGLDNVLHSVSEFIVGKFPQKVIRAVNVDTRDKMKDFYNNAIQGYSGKNGLSEATQELIKIPRPHLYVGYTLDSNFDTVDTGLGESQPWNFPNAYYLDENLSSAMPILHDKDRDIKVLTYNSRIKITAEFLFSCQSKEEQISLYIYIKNFIKDLYTHSIRGISTDYVMPNYLIATLKNALYGENVTYKDIETDLDAYLDRTSLGSIKPVYRNGKEDDKFYEMDYTYERVNLKISGKPQLDDGDKKDAAYDNYTIRFPAVVEVCIPMSYVLRTPNLIPGAIGGVTKIQDAMLLDDTTDKNCNYQTMNVIKRYHDRANRSYIDNNRYKLVARDEFALCESEDFYDVRMCFTEDDILVLEALTAEQRKECYKILMFENDVLLDEDKFYDIDSNYVIHIHDGDVLKNQMIEIYLDVEKASRYLDELRKNIRGTKHV